MDKPQNSCIETIERDLAEIKDKVGHIEERLKRSEKSSRYYFTFGIGLTAMATRMGLATTSSKFAVPGLALFSVGLILTLISNFLFS